MRKIDRIFVHCTASYQENTTVESLYSEFKAKGWREVGYHYVVFPKSKHYPNGKVVQMLGDDKVANGVKGYNAHSIHVAWVGGIDETHPKGIDNRTLDQKVALFDILTKLKLRYRSAIILGHRDVSPDLNHNGIIDPWEYIKGCPCFDAMIEYKDLNKIR